MPSDRDREIGFEAWLEQTMPPSAPLPDYEERAWRGTVMPHVTIEEDAPSEDGVPDSTEQARPRPEPRYNRGLCIIRQRRARWCQPGCPCRTRYRERQGPPDRVVGQREYGRDVQAEQGSPSPLADDEYVRTTYGQYTLQRAYFPDDGWYVTRGDVAFYIERGELTRAYNEGPQAFNNTLDFYYRSQVVYG